MTQFEIDNEHANQQRLKALEVPREERVAPHLQRLKELGFDTIALSARTVKLIDGEE